MKLVCSVVGPATGKKDLYPIILLHAALDSKKTWEIVAPKIADGTGRLVYCVDARNHGDSPWTEDFSLQFMADDIMEFLIACSISKAILVGTGMGGSVAMKVAVQAPEYVDKLIVDGMVPDPYPMCGWKIGVLAAKIFESALEQIPEGSDIIAAKIAVTGFLKTNLLEVQSDVRNENREFALKIMPLKKVGGKYQWEANINAIKAAFASHDFDKGLIGTYGGEVLFLYDVDSDMKVEEDELIPVMFPQALLRPVQGVEWRTHLEMPEEFVKQVVQFINGPALPE